MTLWQRTLNVHIQQQFVVRSIRGAITSSLREDVLVQRNAYAYWHAVWHPFVGAACMNCDVYECTICIRSYLYTCIWENCIFFPVQLFHFNSIFSGDACRRAVVFLRWAPSLISDVFLDLLVCCRLVRNTKLQWSPWKPWVSVENVKIVGINWNE